MTQLKREKIIIIIAIILSEILVLGIIGIGIYFGLYSSKGSAYSLDRIDLTISQKNIPDNLKYLYETTIVDAGDGGETYLAHPDSVIMPTADGQNAIYTFYVLGHGKGEIATKYSLDGGKTYSSRLTNTPQSWQKSEETPTVYRLDFKDGDSRFLLVSACPKWVGYKEGNGFCASITDKDGNWSEFERFYGKDDNPHLYPIVAMSSLVHLKENGKYVDKWMGFFHDNKFRLYSTILSFEEGKMQWSTPTEYLKNSYDKDGKSINQTLKAKAVHLCEVLVVRNDSGNGDVLCMIGRSDTKLINSLMAFSYDEGRTWSELKEIPPELNGERHKAVYDGDRLFITFRSVERDNKLVKSYNASTFISEGCVAWVGSFESLEEWYYHGKSTGQYRIKLFHTYLDGQTTSAFRANPDTGYCGLVIQDGYITVCTYGKAIAESNKTVIISRRIKLDDIDALYEHLTA